MSIPVLNNLDLTRNQLLNALLQVLASAPGSPNAGQVWYNSTSGKIEWRDGTAVRAVHRDDVRLDQIVAPAAPLGLNSQRITGLADGTAAGDAATKGQVDAAQAGLDAKQSVRVATTANVALSGAQTIDGMAVVAGDRVLVKGQTAPAENGVYCLDEQTEILTTGGWKRHDALREGEDALTFNLETGEGEWQPVESVHRFPVVDQEMLSMEGRGHSSLSTLNHRWPVERREYMPAEVRVAVGGRTRGADGRYVAEDECGPWYVIRESHELCEADCLISAAPTENLPTDARYRDEFVELMAWFVTEGHIRKNNSGTLSTGVRIAQSERVNPEYVSRIRDCLRALWGAPTERTRRPRGGSWEAEWRERPNSNRLQLTVFELNTIAGAALCAEAPLRVARAEFVAALTQRQLRLFIDTCAAADGHETENGRRTIGQKAPERLAPMQMAATLLGIATTITRRPDGMHEMTLRKARHTQPHLAGERVRYTGTVWCPRTPNGTWLARRNGTVYFTGNTAAAAAWTRASDMDAWTKVPGAFVFVEEGTANGDKGFVSTANAGGTLGTTAITWSQFTSSGPAGTVQKFAADVTGDAVATQFTVTHNLGSTDVTVAVYDVTADLQVIVDVKRPTANTVRIDFAAAPATGKVYRVCVLG